MADFCWSFAIVLMIAFSTCFGMVPPRKIDTLPPGLKSPEIYSETPCEMRPFSAWKDGNGNLWGVGNNNLWWFNKTNLSWSLLPLPNGTDYTDTWRVSCGDPSSYIALQNSIGGTLVLHLPWQHWQPVDVDEVRTAIDGNASWCDLGNLYATDTARNALYALDPEEARWVLSTDMEKTNDDNRSSFGGTARTWLRPDRQLLLFEQKGTHSQLIVLNLTGTAWTLTGRGEIDSWPQLSDQGITWMHGMDKIWLWQRKGNGAELWVFEMGKSEWKQITNSPINEVQMLGVVLTAWVNANEICFLWREQLCSSNYSPSHTACWNSNESNAANVTRKGHEKPHITLITPSSGINILKATPPSKVLLPFASENQLQENKNDRKMSHISQLAVPTSNDDFELNNQEISDTASIPGSSTPWNQQHSNIFGSVIFFGTSIAIFSIVGFFWCLRRCVHFPKEALLLRDPPSVRYTAIPDSVATCETRGKPATYSIIPDFIA